MMGNIRCSLAHDLAFLSNLTQVNLIMSADNTSFGKQLSNLPIVAVPNAADEKFELLFIGCRGHIVRGSLSSMSAKLYCLVLLSLANRLAVG